MAWEENSCICLHMQLIAILSRIGAIFVNFQDRVKKHKMKILSFACFLLNLQRILAFNA